MARLGLVIDDDTPSRKIYTSLLRSLSFEVMEAADGAQAMSILRESQPELVFLDIRLPKVDGLQILDYIYSSPHLIATRVVIITAHREHQDSLQLRGSDLYLLKPISPREIREMVSETLTS